MEKYKEKVKEVKGYNSKILVKDTPPQRRLTIGLPMTGLVRTEWMLARYGQIIPCNWSQYEAIKWVETCAPINFLVADARNIIVKDCLEMGSEWLLFIDSDVILPPYATLNFNDYMMKGKVPIVSGLYFTKSVPSEPLIYRGRGTSYYDKWHFGDKVWVDGIGMGCTLIHTSILQVLYDRSEEYSPSVGVVCRRVFETPSKVFYDPESNTFHRQTGTEDLFFLTRVVQEEVFKKAGWPSYAKKEFPFLCDTGIFCQHIEPNGVKFPARGEHVRFVRKGTLGQFNKRVKKGF